MKKFNVLIVLLIMFLAVGCVKKVNPTDDAVNNSTSDVSDNTVNNSIQNQADTLANDIIANAIENSMNSGSGSSK